MVLKPDTGCFGTVCRCQVLLENLHLQGQRSRIPVLEHFDLRKHSGPTPADDMTPQTITLTGLYTGLQTTWIVCLSSLPPDSGTLISKGNAKCTFIREHNFGPLSSSPVLSL